MEQRMRGELTSRVGMIVSGGQAGVDRAALDFAIEMNIPYGGWCPAGGWAEDMVIRPGLLRKYPNLRETPSAEPEQRTEWNVRDSSITLILVRGDTVTRSKGTQFTKTVAASLGRPCQLFDMDAATSECDTRSWLQKTLNQSVLNIAGPRESESQGIYMKAQEFLRAVFSA
jgi:hypothetical protein